MDNFIVSARKYRPPTFKMVVGQHSITSTLQNAIKKDQLAQAFLFCGPRGVGKTTCARILAKTINCEHPTEQAEACGTCTSCVSFGENASFNMHELDAASNNSVDDIRSLVDQVRIPPQAGRYKVYIIDEVHMLSASAFNAFLKTLEEPPHYAKFILATTEKHKILPTILSRCQIFDFRRITVDDIAHHLAYVAEEEEIKAEQLALHLIAQKSDGALRDALSIFDQIASSTEGHITYQAVIDNLNILDYDYYFKMTSHVFRGDTTETLLLIDTIIDNGFDGLQFAAGFASHLRNLLVCKNAETIKLLEVSQDIKEQYGEQSAAVPAGLLMKALDITSQCETSYKVSNNKRLHVELAFLNLCLLTDQPAPAAQKSLPQENAPAVQKAVQKTEIVPQLPKEQAVDKAEKKPKAVLKISEVISIKKPLINTQEASNAAEPEAVYENQSYTDAGFNESWKAYAEKIRETQPHLFSTMSRLPVRREDHVFELSVANKVQQDQIVAKRGDILAYLRKELNNGLIMLEAVVSETEAERKYLSPEEKFHKMADKNPEINGLKNQLDLEIDY